MQARYHLSRPFVAGFLIVLCIIAAYIRTAGAGNYHYSPDEIGYIEMAKGHTLANILHYSQFETHPPLGHIVRHYWMLLSDAPWFMRSLSLLPGLLLIPLYHLIGARLSGSWAGLCCATLIAFSHGCILQSYLLRNYTWLLLFLSLGFHAYIRWRAGRHFPQLLLYGLASLLACLTHFSGLFAVFCIAAVESVTLLRSQQERKFLPQWIAVNLCIAAACAGVMHFWQPVLIYTHDQLATLAQNQQGFFYPFILTDYFFAYRPNGLYAFMLFAFVMYGLGVAAQRLPALRPFTVMALLSLLLGWGLVLAGNYNDGSIRCNLWALPFFIAPLGCALALACEYGAAILSPGWVAAVLLLLSGMLYSPAERFSDPNEYMISGRDWRAYTDYLKNLDASHLIIASRNDAFLISYPEAENPYDAYIQKGRRVDIFHDGFTALLPYHAAWLMFRPAYFNYTGSDLTEMVRDADTRKELQGIRTLVFTSTLWSSNNTNVMLACTELDKTVIRFDSSASEESGNAYPPALSPLLLLVTKQAFLDQLATPEGKAHHCLK